LPERTELRKLLPRGAAATGRYRRQREGHLQQRRPRDRPAGTFIRCTARPPRRDQGRGVGAEVESTAPEDVGSSCNAGGAGDAVDGPRSPSPSDVTSTGGSTATGGGGASGGMSI